MKFKIILFFILVSSCGQINGVTNNDNGPTFTVDTNSNSLSQINHDGKSVEWAENWSSPTHDQSKDNRRQAGPFTIIRTTHLRTQVKHTWTVLPSNIIHRTDSFMDKHFNSMTISDPPVTKQMDRMLGELKTKVSRLPEREQNSVFNIDESTLENSKNRMDELFKDIKNQGNLNQAHQHPTYMQYKREIISQEGIAESKKMGQNGEEIQTRPLTWGQSKKSDIVYEGLSKVEWDPQTNKIKSFQQLDYKLAEAKVFQFKQSGWTTNSEGIRTFNGNGEFTVQMSTKNEQIAAQPFIGTYTDANTNSPYHTLEWHFPEQYGKSLDSAEKSTSNKINNLNSGAPSRFTSIPGVSTLKISYSSTSQQSNLGGAGCHRRKRGISGKNSCHVDVNDELRRAFETFSTNQDLNGEQNSNSNGHKDRTRIGHGHETQVIKSSSRKNHRRKG